ncbi:general secretion pathway protein GspD [Planctomycetales bacterium]|nr:general secretion pathway protein GspD [Planctomycetales bacterium]
MRFPIALLTLLTGLSGIACFAETTSVTPKSVQLAQIEQSLHNVLGKQITNVASNQFSFNREKIINQQIIRKQCTLVFEHDQRRIVLNGDLDLCNQIVAFINVLDAPQTANNNIRRLVRIQYAKPQTLAKAFESYRVPKALRNIQPLPLPPSQKSIEQVQYQFEAPRREIPIANEMPRAAPTGFANGFVNGYTNGGVPNGVMLADGTNPNEVNIASDFRYQILPDLDVVVIDATGAEVARFTDMIRQIEELSKRAEPQIEVVFLKNVNCVSIHGVIGQIYNQMFKAEQGAVTVMPMVDPNAMLLVGWGKSMESMKTLISKLDTPIAGANSRLKVYTLKHASAAYALTVLRGTFPVPQENSGFMPRVAMFSDPRSNSLVVQAAPNELEAIEKILNEIDIPTNAVKLRVKPVKLKHSLAGDMVQVLSQAVLAGTAGTEDKKLPALELIVEDAKGKRLVESGILADATFVADIRNNAIIVTAPESCMSFLEELIAKIDAPASAAEVKVFPILHGDANALVKTLQSLLPTQLDGVPGPQLPGAESEDNLIPIRFAVDARTNCILAAGSQGDLQIIEALLLSLDREDKQSRKESIFELKSMKAEDVADAINEYIRSRRLIQQESPGVISAYQQIESEVIIVPEPKSNTLIVSATPKYYDEIINLIKEIDKSPPQVQIRVLIGEVTLNEGEEFGAEFGIQDSLLFGRSGTATSSGGVTTLSPGWAFNDSGTGSNTNALGNSPNANALASAGNVASQVLTNFATGRVGAETGFTGMAFSASSDSVSILLRALQETKRLEVLSCPSITAMNNQPAVIHVGKMVARYRGAVVNANSTDLKISDEKVGLMLTVTPNISPEGNVVMAVVATKSKVGSQQDGVNIGTAASPLFVPNIDLINAATMISAANNETVVLGGLISKEDSRLNRKVPLLGDIPVVGKLFQYNYNHCERKELLIILTPTIVRDKDDMEKLKQMEVARMTWCLQNVSKVYGDIGAYNVISETPYIGNAPVFHPEAVKSEDLKELPPTLAPPVPTLPKK